jgi:hypothetical protein
MDDSNNNQKSGQGQSDEPVAPPASSTTEPSNIPPSADPSLFSVIQETIDQDTIRKNEK